MSIIDTHTHLDSFADQGALEAVLARAGAAGVEAMIAIGTEPADWARQRDIARAHPGRVHFTVGLHPCGVDAGWARAVAQLEAFWTEVPAPVGLGETGLDRFHLPKDSAEAARVYAWQREAFAAQLALAKRLGCPLVIHSREAFAECVAMIDGSGVDWTRVVFHCFSEGAAEMAELSRRGGRASFTGILTYKNAAGVRAAAEAQGLARCMIETDAPYLAPAPHRGKPNEPAFLRHTAEYAAEMFGVSYETLAATTTANAREFFRLGPAQP
jgi:TatD DNase family protein